ncbi:hypothetical protein ACTFIY_007955 [Dictyostelium cf. discoideum]
MYLYNLTLQRPTSVYQSISGNFSGTKQVEIVLNHGRSLELIRYDENGKMQSVLYTEVFGVIRSIIPFRLTSGTKDYIIVGSDSGRVVILEYNSQKNQFDKIHQETFGRSGCRRIVPGQYLAVDPKGRAFMIGAIEKQKLVYILNRDSSANLTISSPLEAHKSNTIVFSMCGVDVGFDNPIFATISVDYTEEDGGGGGSGSIEEMMDEDIGKKKKLLTYYELDLGLNNVVRKWSDQVDDSANIVMTVPGGTEGPGGVLVASEDYIVYRNQDHAEVRSRIPRRYGSDPSKGVLITSHSSHKQKGMFFFLIQSEHGDLYKITLDYQGDQVSEVNVNYFDTIVLANCLTVLKNGFLFAASEFGDHTLYFFKSIGDEEEEGQAKRLEDKDGHLWFTPRNSCGTKMEELKNLEPTSHLSSLSPIIDFKVLDLVREENPQLYSLCGTSLNSSLKVLRHGLSVTTITTANLPGVPSGIWTVPKSTSPNAIDQTDKYIVVSFVGTTSVLSVGDTIQENHESGILETTTTLLVKSMGDDAIIQVFPTGFRHIKSDLRINEWRAPGRKTIVRASANQSQLAIALSGGEIIYFELDQASNLIEIIKKDLRRDVACIEISPIPKGRNMARFIAVSDWEGPIRVLSLDRDNCLGQVSMLDTDKVYIESLSIIEMQLNEMGIETKKSQSQTGQTTTTTTTTTTSSSVTSGGSLFLFVGLKNGVVKRATLDSVTGELSDIRTRLLGRKPVKLFKVKVRGSNAMLALSSRVWLNYINQGKLDIVPLSIEPLENASNLSSEQSAESIVATSENKIIIFSIDKLGDLFNQETIKLNATPKRFIIHPQTSYIIILETETNYNTDNIDIDKINEQSEKLLLEKQKELQQEMDIDDDQDNNDQNNEIESSFKKLFKPKAGKGKWKSYIKIMDPITHESLESLMLEDGEAGFSVCTCSFGESGEIFLVVGCVTDMVLNPKSHKSAHLNLYRFIDGGKKLELLYKTEVEEPVYAMAQFQGKLVCGVGKSIRIYDMGKKKLLRKCETKNLPNTIVNIHSLGDRLVVGDIQESIHFIKYKRSENMLYVFADDLAPRWMTSSVMLDYDTVAGADKFGNIFVLRLPLLISDEVEEDPTGTKLKFESGTLNGAPHKLDHIANFFVGDTVTTLNKTSLVVGGPEVILYTTISGAIGALIPFTSREDVDFFSTLEMNMRSDCLPLCGRDHLAYRSYYFPVKNIIDGDLCEQFSTLNYQKQLSISEELSRSPSEVIKKLEEIRSQKLL